MKSISIMPSLALLAGGLATRLRPLTTHLPKALIPIANKPFIEQQLILIANQGFKQIVICAGFLGEQIQSCVGNGERFGLSIEYSFDGDPLLGTGGALKKALPLLSDTFVVMYGDSFLPTSFAPIINYFKQSDAMGLMTVFRNNGLWDKSNVEFSAGRILNYDKKNMTPQMHYIDYGFGLFRQQALADFPENGFFDLSLVYQQLLQRQQLAAVEVKERFYEIGSLNGIKDLEKYILEKQHELYKKISA